MATFKFEEIDGEQHRCGYRLKQHVLQTKDVDAKIVEKAYGYSWSEVLLVADADKGESYEERRTLDADIGDGNDHSARLETAKKILISNVLRIAPNAKPGKRSA